MKYLLISVLFVSFTSAAFSGSSSHGKTTPTASTEPVITEKSVWQGGVGQCQQEQEVADCFIKRIEKNGTQEAYNATQYLLSEGMIGYVSAYRKEGPVGVATIERPFMANTNTTTMLVPSKGDPIDVDDFNGDEDQFPAWLALKKRQPDASPWSPATLIQTNTTDEKVLFTFSYPVQTCHACRKLATLHVRYEFSKEGRFLGKSITEIK